MGAAPMTIIVPAGSSSLYLLINVESGSKYPSVENSALPTGLSPPPGLVQQAFPSQPFVDDLPDHLSQSIIQVISNLAYLLWY